MLQVLPSLVTGGVERGAVDIAAALASAGARSIVASAGGPMVAELDAAGAEHVALPMAHRSPAVIAANALRLARLVRRAGVDIVHARSRAPAWSAYAACRATGTRLVTTFHGAYGARSWPKRRYNAVMAAGDPVIAVSGFIATELRAVYGVPSARIRMIHRGVDLDRFAPAAVAPERVARLRAQWRVAARDRIVLLPGRLTRWKGQTLLVEAAARLAAADVVVVLAGAEQGRAGYRRALEEAIARSGLAGRVRLVGPCADMPAALAAADAVVSASLAPEAFGRVMAEALAMGRPLVAAAHGAAPEIVSHGETGWLFAPGDVAGLAASLDRALAAAPAQRAAMGSRAIADARRRFGRTLMCAKTLAVYAELLGSPSAGIRSS